MYVYSKIILGISLLSLLDLNKYFKIKSTQFRTAVSGNGNIIVPGKFIVLTVTNNM